MVNLAVPIAYLLVAVLMVIFFIDDERDNHDKKK